MAGMARRTGNQRQRPYTLTWLCSAGQCPCHRPVEAALGLGQYLWGDALRRFFDLPGAGHMIVTNLHADTFDQARRQVCEENSVPAAAFRRVNLLFFLAVERQGHGSRRRIAAVWESDGTGEHRQVFDGGAGAPVGSGLVSTGAFQAAGRRIDRLLQAKVRRIEDVRAALVGLETET